MVQGAHPAYTKPHECVASVGVAVHTDLKQLNFCMGACRALVSSRGAAAALVAPNAACTFYISHCTFCMQGSGVQQWCSSSTRCPRCSPAATAVPAGAVTFRGSHSCGWAGAGEVTTCDGASLRLLSLKVIICRYSDSCEVKARRVRASKACQSQRKQP